MKTLAPAVPRVLILGTRWQAQLSVQVAFRQDLLSRRPMPFPIALDRLLCVVPNRHSHCSQALHHALLRPKSSSTHVDVQMGLGPVASQSVAFKLSALPFQGSPRTFFNSLITNLSSGGTRCNDLAFWTPFSVRMMCSSVIGALPTQIPWPISDPDCLLARMCTCTSLFLRMAILGSCTLSQKHAQTQFSRRFSLEISSSTMLHVKSTTQTRCCRLVVFLAEDPQVITTSHDRHH